MTNEQLYEEMQNYQEEEESGEEEDKEIAPPSAFEVTFSLHRIRWTSIGETLPKAQQTQGLSDLTKVAVFKSYHKPIKIQLQHLIQTSASKF